MHPIFSKKKSQHESITKLPNRKGNNEEKHNQCQIMH